MVFSNNLHGFSDNLHGFLRLFTWYFQYFHMIFSDYLHGFSKVFTWSSHMIYIRVPMILHNIYIKINNDYFYIH